MSIHPVDIHVGERLRQRRTFMGISQGDLGESVGVTFQQIQKYERGLNRIGSSRLFEIANILNVRVEYFFEGLNREDINYSVLKVAECESTYDYDIISSKEMLTLVRCYHSIKQPNVRKKIFSLIKSIAETYSNQDNKNLENDNGLAVSEDEELPA